MRKWWQVWYWLFDFPYELQFATPLFAIQVAFDAYKYNECAIWSGIYLSWGPRNVREGEMIHSYRKEIVVAKTQFRLRRQ